MLLLCWKHLFHGFGNCFDFYFITHSFWHNFLYIIWLVMTMFKIHLDFFYENKIQFNSSETCWHLPILHIKAESQLLEAWPWYSPSNERKAMTSHYAIDSMPLAETACLSNYVGMIYNNDFCYSSFRMMIFAYHRLLKD